MKILLSTYVPAPPTAVFDMSLDIGTHLDSMSGSGERAIHGVTKGIIELGQSVTWRAKHFGINWTMTSTITEWDRPHCFVDQQSKGPFRSFRHVHTFTPEGEGTRMTDDIDYRAPMGFAGDYVDKVILNRYLRRLIEVRNDFIVDAAATKL